MYGERGIVLSKQAKTVLKIYVSIFIGIVVFFIGYAYRNEVLIHISKENYQSYMVSDKTIEQIKTGLKKYSLNDESYNDISTFLENELQGYSYTLSIYNELSIFNEDTYQDYYPFEETITKECTIEFQNGSTGRLSVRANFQSFYHSYTLIIGSIGVLITVLCYCLFSLFERKQVVNKLFKRVGRVRFFNKLSFQLISINLVAGILAISLYLLMYEHRYVFFGLLRDSMVSEDTSSVMNAIRKETKDLDLEDTNYNKIQAVIEKYQEDYMDIIVYSEKDVFYANIKSFNIESSIEGSFSNILTINSPIYYTYMIDFKNTSSLVLVYSYPLYKYVLPYIFVISAIAVSFYIIPFLWFIQSKVSAIRKMQKDVEILANGSLEHQIIGLGSDEIGELGRDLNSMRESFLASMESEMRLRESNKDLITSMSHDLRTPLTALMGYLDILRLKKGNPVQMEKYLEKAMEKVEQIKTLSDAMFEYFLVYGQDEKIELKREKIRVWEIYIEESIQLLESQGYQVITKFVGIDAEISLNIHLMKRILDNLFSNILKYADIKHPIIITSELRKGNYQLCMNNTKLKETGNIESNQIGLKSVEKIVQIHGGEFVFRNNENFMIMIKIPLQKNDM